MRIEFFCRQLGGSLLVIIFGLVGLVAITAADVRAFELQNGVLFSGLQLANTAATEDDDELIDDDDLISDEDEEADEEEELEEDNVVKDGSEA